MLIVCTTRYPLTSRCAIAIHTQMLNAARGNNGTTTTGSANMNGVFIGTPVNGNILIQNAGGDMCFLCSRQFNVLLSYFFWFFTMPNRAPPARMGTAASRRVMFFWGYCMLQAMLRFRFHYAVKFRAA